jgi:hypothetical protein
VISAWVALSAGPIVRMLRSSLSGISVSPQRGYHSNPARKPRLPTLVGAIWLAPDFDNATCARMKSGDSEFKDPIQSGGIPGWNEKRLSRQPPNHK